MEAIRTARHDALKTLAIGLIVTTLAACGGGGGGGGGGTTSTGLSATVAYRANDAVTRGAPELYLSGTGESLTGRLVELDSSFKVTPDRRSVLFIASTPVAPDSRALYRVDLARPRQLVQLSRTPVAGGNVARFEISPDGSKVVYSGDMDIQGVREIYLVNLDGTAEHKINGSVGTPPQVELYLPARGAWSKDGRYILQVVRNLSDARAIGLNQHDVSLATANSTRITPTPWSSTASIDDPAWLPDASGVVFYLELAQPNAVGLFFMQRDSANGWSPALNAVNRALPSGGAILDYAPVPDSSGIVFLASSGTAGHFELFRAGIDAVSGVVDAPFRLGDAQPATSYGVAAFAISPDGSRVAYVADQVASGRFDLFTASATAAGAATAASGPLPAGHNVQQVAFVPNNGNAVVYRSCFVGAAGSSDCDLSVVDLTTPARPERLNGAKPASTSVAADFSITPDGSAVVYRGDLVTAGTQELFYTRFDSPGVSTRISATRASGTDVDAFAAY